MRILIVCILSTFVIGVSCKTPSSSYQSSLMKRIYQNQKTCYNNISVNEKGDYTSIINFGSKGRIEFYKKNEVPVTELKDFIILEGFSPGWGSYQGALISPQKSYAYKNSSSGTWHMELINSNNTDDIVSTLGIDKFIIDKVKIWDTVYINNKKKEIGGHVRDGFAFMATRIQFIDDHHQKIETISFSEFRP